MSKVTTKGEPDVEHRDLSPGDIKAILDAAGTIDNAYNIGRIRKGEFNPKELEAAEALAELSEPFKLLMPTKAEISTAQSLIDLSEAEEFATAEVYKVFDDLQEEAPLDPPQKGSRRKLKGGSQTGDAILALKNSLVETKNDLTDSLDKLAAAIVRQTPNLIKKAFAAKLILYIASNPSLLSQLAYIVRDNWVYLVPVGAQYDEIRDALISTVRTLGALSTSDQVEYSMNNPLYPAILLAALVRISKPADQTSMDFLKTKTKYALSVNRMVYTGGVEVVRKLIKEGASVKSQIASLREEIKNLKRKDGIVYEGLGPAEIEGLMRQIPSPAGRAAQAAETLVAVLRARAAAAQASGLTTPAAPASGLTTPAAPADQMEVVEEGKQAGRRRRKTKKRAIKKRKMTRRRLTFSY